VAFIALRLWVPIPIVFEPTKLPNGGETTDATFSGKTNAKSFCNTSSGDIFKCLGTTLDAETFDDDNESEGVPVLLSQLTDPKISLINFCVSINTLELLRPVALTVTMPSAETNSFATSSDSTPKAGNGAELSLTHTGLTTASAKWTAAGSFMANALGSVNAQSVPVLDKLAPLVLKFYHTI
jgi:hypothetical protein